MLITVDLAHPDNDIEIIGLAPDEALETRLGPRGYVAYRLFSAATRLFFLALQKTTKPDVAAATQMMIAREANFVRERLQELTK